MLLETSIDRFRNLNIRALRHDAEILTSVSFYENTYLNFISWRIRNIDERDIIIRCKITLHLQNVMYRFSVTNNTNVFTLD